jgi:hypothetical protein
MQTSRVPPYVSFRTLLTQIERMATEGVPSKIDQYFLTNMAGGTQNHFRHALRVLGLIDENNRTTDLLREVVAGEAEGRKAKLGQILSDRFPELVALGTDASKSDFLEVLSEYGAKSADSQRKALTFYVAAAEYSGMPISNHVKSGRAPSSPRRSSSPRRGKSSNGSGTPGGSGTAQNAVPAGGNGYARTLQLKSGGTVTLTWDVNMAYSTQEDEDFVMGLVRALRSYQSGNSGNEVHDKGDAP